MPSIIESYKYDIFISYRQKDNKGDRWVSKFVETLKTELESTFKEEISVYFDINPHDGLLETHDVDESLKEKLKCLVFIPIISRTYCDHSSFAWEHEFKAFVVQGSGDQFGLKIKLTNGNVASRVLPVLIHDLDMADVKECELVLGGTLRGIEFIYREPGVNKPLTADDDEKKNLNNTKYRIQINKTANAIKEIISGLKKEPVATTSERKETLFIEDKPNIKEKSIIVLPFENISSDADQEYFSDGLTEEIITDLSNVGDLLVISRSSAMTFKGAKATIKEITNKMNVRYVLEGSVRKAGNNIRINAQLIDGTNDSHIWAKKYAGTLEDIFDIQEKVSQSIANALKIKLSSEEKKKIHERPIDNVFAYDCYKRAYPEINSMTLERLDFGLNLLQKGLDIVGENAVIYAGIAFAYLQYVNLGVEHENNIKKAEEFVHKALDLDEELAEAHFTKGVIYLLDGKADKFFYHLVRAHVSKPEDSEIIAYLAYFYSLFGKIDVGKSFISKLIRIDPINSWIDSNVGWNHFYGGRFDLALDPLFAAYNLNPESGMNQFWKSLVLFYNDHANEAYEFICKFVEEPGKDTWTRLTIFLKYVIKKDIDKLTSLLIPDFVKSIQIDLQNSYNIATFYCYLSEKTKALEWLENAVMHGFINYPFLNEYDPFLKNIRGEERFKKLMDRVKNEWENIKV
jgi:TolB-like protein/lipoprotein NlpI